MAKAGPTLQIADVCSSKAMSGGISYVCQACGLHVWARMAGMRWEDTEDD